MIPISWLFSGIMFAAHSTHYHVLFFLSQLPVVCLICYCTLIVNVFPTNIYATQARPFLSLDLYYYIEGATWIPYPAFQLPDYLQREVPIYYTLGEIFIGDLLVSLWRSCNPSVLLNSVSLRIRSLLMGRLSLFSPLYLCLRK